MEHIKENARAEFMGMISHSWTWERMTEAERAAFNECVYNAQVESAMKGTHCQRWAVLHAVYAAYLAGIGYDGPNWREPVQKTEEAETPLWMIKERHIQRMTVPAPFGKVADCY